MKCPKCGYLGFETVDRCRNCGYDFSLAPSSVNLPELPLRIDTESLEPLEDLTLVGTALTRTPASLPLFSNEDDAPLITKASPPRAPLSVRRAPEVPKLRTAPPRAPMLDWSPAESAEATVAGNGDQEPAALTARLSAFLLDVLVLLAVDAVVVYLTIQICGLTLQDVSLIPRSPLIAFLVFQNVAYFVAFTAGGQTLGKMATGIRVVPMGGDASVEFGPSVVRTLVWLVLAIPAGLGFLSTLLTSDRRGLHDRLAGTRVVRASV